MFLLSTYGMNAQLLQLVLSLVAIFLLVLLAKIYWPKTDTLDKDRVKRAFDRSDYKIKIQDIWIDTSNSAALALLDDDMTIGYAFTFGDRVTCRTLTADDIKYVQHQENQLDIKFSDYTLNNLVFDFGDSLACSQALDALTILKPANEV